MEFEIQPREVPMTVENDSEIGQSSNSIVTNISPHRKRKRGQTDDGLETESTEESKKPPKYFIAIHLGAGKHSLKKKDEYRELCKSACEKALSLLKKGQSADDAVVAATKILESSGRVNAGKGSNLTLDKTVECDAGFMNGDGLFGGVGALPGVPNPVLVAKKIAELQNDVNKLSCGRVPPNFLVGHSAKKWAESQGIPTCQDENLISKLANKTYLRFMEKINNQTSISETLVSDDNVNDTVGAIAMDKNGGVAATVSSGGNWLKFPGRIGHSPQFGSGCWASNQSEYQDNNCSSVAVAVSTTGVGEMLSKIHWASECCESLRNVKFDTAVEAISQAIKYKFLGSQLLKHDKETKIGGVIALIWDGFVGEFVFGHTSQSMIVGYGGSDLKKVEMKFSCLPVGGVVGESVAVEGIRF